VLYLQNDVLQDGGSTDVCLGLLFVTVKNYSNSSSGAAAQSEPWSDYSLFL
jgi:hypothetical protein